MIRVRAASLAALAAIAGALVPVPNAATADRSSRAVVTLAKKTVVTATRHSHVMVRVPEDVSITELRTSLTGGGRVAGYALTNWGEEREDDDLLVFSFAVNRCLEPGCPAAEQPLSIRWGSGLTNGVIPAGTYDLYVVADEASVTITFKDRYLRGRTSLSLEGDRPDVELRTLPMSATSTSDGTVFSGGDFTELESGRGVGMLGLWAQGPVYAGGAFGSCFYFSKALVASEDHAFLPGCPTGSSASRYPAIPSAPGEPGGVIYQSSYMSLPMGIGGWAASTGRIESFGAVGLWLRF